MTGKSVWAETRSFPEKKYRSGRAVKDDALPAPVHTGDKDLLTGSPSDMGTSPGGSASLVTRNRRYAGGEV